MRIRRGCRPVALAMDLIAEMPPKQLGLFGCTVVVPEKKGKQILEPKPDFEAFAGGYVLRSGILHYKHKDESVVPVFARDLDLTDPEQRKRATCYCGLIHMG